MRNLHIPLAFKQALVFLLYIGMCLIACLVPLIGCSDANVPNYMKSGPGDSPSQKPVKLEVDRFAKIAPLNVPITTEMHNIIELNRGNYRVNSIKIKLNFASADYNRLTLVGMKSANTCLNGFLSKPTFSLSLAQNQVVIAEFTNEIGLKKNKSYTILIEFDNFQCDDLNLKMDLLFALDMGSTASNHLSLAKVCDGPDNSQWIFMDKEPPLNVFKSTSGNEQVFLGAGSFCGQASPPQIYSQLTCNTDYDDDSNLTGIQCSSQAAGPQFNFNYKFDPQNQTGNLTCFRNNELLRSIDISNCATVIRP